MDFLNWNLLISSEFILLNLNFTDSISIYIYMCVRASRFLILHGLNRLRFHVGYREDAVYFC